MKPFGPLGFLLLAGCLVGGCAKKPATLVNSGTNGPKKPENVEPEERLGVVTTAGTADRRDPVKNTKLYTVTWKSSALELAREGIREGKMNDVGGTVYEEEKAKSTFTADTGYAKKETQTLFLEGRVVVKSPQYRSTLRAKKLEWLPDVKRYKATGNVTVDGPWGQIGPADELLASSDLKTIGTPKAFLK